MKNPGRGSKSGSAVVQKEDEVFGLVTEIGTLVVPKNYKHETYLTDSCGRIGHGSRVFSDDHYPNPTRVMRPGDKFRVSAFKQKTERTCYLEQMEFLRELPGVVFTGAQGAAIVWELLRDRMPKDLWLLSMDEPPRLWTESSCCYIPMVCNATKAHPEYQFNGHFIEGDVLGDDKIGLLAFQQV